MNEANVLKKEISELKTLINNQNARLEQYQESYEILQQQVRDLLRHRFGRRSEKISSEELKKIQRDMFEDEPSINQIQTPELDKEDITVPAHKRRKKVKKETSKYPRDIQIISVDEKDKLCDCGCLKTVIRYETKELFHYQPAQYRIVEQRREVVACKKGCEGSIQSAPTPQHILPKTKATEEMLASVIINKLHHRQPHYHLEKYCKNIGISRETMARWMIKLTEPLQPLYNLMKDEIIDYDIGALDATTLQVLKEPGRKPEVKSYLYCIRGGPPKKLIILYDYNASHHQAFIDQWFEGYQGYLHMDADNFWNLMLEDPYVHASYCHSHARRKFEAVAKHAKKQGLAHDAIRYYKKLYRIERQAKADKLSCAERFQLRLKEAKPLLDELKAWLDRHYSNVLPKSPLAKAFEYCIKRWEHFLSYLNDGRLEIDNNLTEQEIKPVVIARKNFMFANSVDGAQALCLHFSLIRTALLHGLEPYEYYVELLKATPHCEAIEDFEKLLPWNIVKTHPELLTNLS